MFTPSTLLPVVVPLLLSIYSDFYLPLSHWIWIMVNSSMSMLNWHPYGSMGANGSLNYVSTQKLLRNHNLKKNGRYEYQCDLSLKWWVICYAWYVSKVHQTGGDLIISNGIWYFCRVFLNLLYIIAMLLWPLNSHVLSYSMHLITKVHILNYVCSWNAGKRGQPKYLEKALCLYADDRQLEEWRIR